MAGHLVMPEIIAEFIELVEDGKGLTRGAQLVALVKNFLDVGFGAGRFDGLARHLGQPVKTFLAHAFGQDGNGVAGQQVGVIGPAPAVVTGGWPDSLHGGWIKLPGHKPGDKAGIGGPDLVGAGGKPFAKQNDDTGIDSGQFLGENQVINAAEFTSFCSRFVMPGDAKEVERV